jgi:hypothetical protein
MLSQTTIDIRFDSKAVLMTLADIAHKQMRILNNQKRIMLEALTFLLLFPNSEGCILAVTQYTHCQSRLI